MGPEREEYMENFTFYSPTFFDFGRGTEKDTGKLVKRFGGSKVLLHYGGGSIKKSGLYDRVIASLKAEGVNFVELGGVKPNPRSGLVYEGIELARKEKVDFVLAVGGGSVIDSSKAIAAGVCYDGDFIEFYRSRIVVEKALPVGVVLTIAAAGSEGSPNTVITDEETKIKSGATGEVLRPAFAIMNPELTFTLDPYQTAAGATDIMIHICERYFSNTPECTTTDRLCEALLKTMVYETPRVIQKPDDYEARANIMWAGMVAHNNICGVGREQDWASHHLEHELSALYDVTHGAGLAVIAPAWMKHCVATHPEKFIPFATEVWGVPFDSINPMQTALEGIKRFRDFLDSIGMPASFSQIGAKKDDIPVMVDRIFAKKKTEGHYIELTKEDVTSIYNMVADA